MIDMSLPPRADVERLPVLRQSRSTVAYALLTASLIVFQVTVFVPAALLDCGARYGRRTAWIAFALAAGIAALVGPAVLKAPDARLAISYLTTIVLSHALPAVVAVPLLQKRASFGKLVATMLLVAIAGLGLAEIGTRTLGGFSMYALELKQSTESVKPALEVYRKSGMPSDALQLMERMVGYWSTTLLPSGFLTMAVIAFVLSVLMVGRLSAWRGRNAVVEDGTYLFRNFALPDWILFAFVIGGLAPLTHGVLQAVLANVLAVAVFLFAMQGFALFRFLLAAMGVGFLGAVIASMLVFFSGIGGMLLSIAGLFDPFFDFRHFKKRKDDSHESHPD